VEEEEKEVGKMNDIPAKLVEVAGKKRSRDTDGTSVANADSKSHHRGDGESSEGVAVKKNKSDNSNGKGGVEVVTGGNRGGVEVVFEGEDEEAGAIDRSKHETPVEYTQAEKNGYLANMWDEVQFRKDRQPLVRVHVYT
jgi:hypothetical protein